MVLSVKFKEKADVLGFSVMFFSNSPIFWNTKSALYPF